MAFFTPSVTFSVTCTAWDVAHARMHACMMVSRPADGCMYLFINQSSSQSFMPPAPQARTWCSRSMSFSFSIAADAARPVARATYLFIYIYFVLFIIGILGLMVVLLLACSHRTPARPHALNAPHRSPPCRSPP